MKVLYFTRGYSPHDERFLKALSRTENEIYFLRLEENPATQLPARIHEMHLLAAPHGSSRIRTLTRNLQRLVEVLKPDLVHAGPVHGPAYIAARAGIHPLVSMSWGSDLLYDANRSIRARLKCRYTLNHTDIFVGDCQAVAGRAMNMGFSREHIFLFPWGVDLKHFTPDGSSSWREKLGWQKNFVFLSSRSFEKIYGVDVIIRAFGLAVKRCPDMRLLLLGRGSLETHLRKLVDDSGVTGKVHFAAFTAREDLPDIYRSADVYLSASHSDGSSVSLMEALACGTPALVSDIAGNLEWIDEGKNGWTFKDHNSRELAEKMCAAYEKQNLDAMRKAARITAEKRANWATNFPVLLQAYQAALETRK